MSADTQEHAHQDERELAEYIRAGMKRRPEQAFGAPQGWGMTYIDEEATLSYVLPLKAPAANKLVTVEIYDPSYFVAFSLAEGDAVTLAGAPKGCSMTITRPKPLDSAQQQTLSESFFAALDAASNYGAQFSNRALVACP